MKDEMFEFQKHALLGDISGQPLCGDFKAAWRACGNDKEMLVRLALMQQSTPYVNTACYQKMGLTKEYIMKEFEDYINGKRMFEDVEGVTGYTYEVFVGYEKPLTVRTDVVSFMWHNGDVTVEESKCPILYVSNNSEIHLTLCGYNSPRIYLFDESKVVIEDCDEECCVFIYKYGDKTVVEEGKYCFGKVKQFNKTLRL